VNVWLPNDVNKTSDSAGMWMFEFPYKPSVDLEAYQLR